MALTATVTPGKTFVSSELVTNSKLNQAAAPSVTLAGTADGSQISNYAVLATKLAFATSTGGSPYYCAAATAGNVITLTAGNGYTFTDANLVAGCWVAFTADADTTDAVNLVLSGGTAKDFFKAVGTELLPGDIRAGQSVVAEYDGTQWQMVSRPCTPAVIVGIDEGEVDAYEITPKPSVRALADITGLPLVFKANTINTGEATLAVSELAAALIVKNHTVPLDSGDIEAGQWVTVVYDGANFQMQSPAVASSNRVTVSVRQTVLGCSVDSTGLPNFLGTGATTTSVYLQNGATTPLVVTFAYGNHDTGAVDYVTRISANGATWTGLGGDTTYYLYVDRNVSTGAITYDHTLSRPNYTRTNTVGTGSGNFTYLINTGFMYEGNAASTPIQRVFVGEATTVAGAVTSVTAYMPRGEFQSPADIVFALDNSSDSQTHRLGLSPEFHRWVMVNQNGSDGHAAGDLVSSPPFGGSGVFPELFANATTLTLRYMFAQYPPYVFSAAASPALLFITPANWKIRFYARRGW